MNDIEERLRADLLTATRGVDSDLDELHVLRTARLARHNRTLRRVAVVTALVLVVGVTGRAGVSRQLGRGTAPVVATPAPTTPTPSPSGGSGTTATVTFGTDDPFPADLKIARVTVTAHRVSATSFAGEITVVAADGSTSRYPVDTVGDELACVQVAPRLVVGVVPHQFDWIQYLDDGDNAEMGGSGSDDQVLSGLDATAYYRLFDTAGTYPGSRGYLWQYNGSSLQDSKGEWLSSMGSRLPLAGQLWTLYQDSTLDVLGFRDESGQTSTTVARHEVQSFGGFPDKAGGVAVQGIVLPVGASRPKLNSASTDLESDVGSLDDRVAIIAAGHVASVDGLVVQAVTYTDADGKRVTKELR